MLTPDTDLPELPTNVDDTYPDDPTRPDRKIHQRHHDALDAQYNPWRGIEPQAVDAAIAAAAAAAAAEVGADVASNYVKSNGEITAGSVILETAVVDGGAAFAVSCDNGAPGIGMRARFSVENNLDATPLVDVNFRQCSINIGNPNPSASTAVSFDFYSPAGATGAYMRAWRPGSFAGGSGGNTALAWVLGSAGDLILYAGGQASNALTVKRWEESNQRFYITEFGAMNWGTGVAATDTNLYRSAADVLATDDDFECKTIGKGVILKSPAGTRYRVTVADDGALTTAAA